MNMQKTPPSFEEANLILLKEMHSDDLDIRKKARNTLAVQNYHLIQHTANGFKNRGINLEDILGLCQLGFVKAMENYNIGFGVPFRNHCRRCMKNEVMMYLRKVQTRTETSLDEVIGSDEEGNELILKNVVSANDEDQLEIIIKNEQVELLELVLDRCQKCFSTTEYQIFQCSYLEEMSYKQIASSIGISTSYTSRVLKRTLPRVRKIAREYGLILDED
ncbi:sigma-70 family RNA polymerase sigma factor [Paenibacillus sp. 22594]|uniref:sigma-70 family RNA polymerase sigma factor n=1 Tax=Paenibacillus sp. 22594 TaxID=3453947 RepID=UPI003F834D0A